MLRDKLISNIEGLNIDEKILVRFVTKKDITWFFDKDNVSDDSVVSVLYTTFFDYFSKLGHPCEELFDKVINGAYTDKLIYQTDLYDKSYEYVAKLVNDLWGSDKRSLVLIQLKAFAERDCDELEDKYEVDIDKVLSDIEKYADVVVNNLDERDLETIVLFCGVDY